MENRFYFKNPTQVRFWISAEEGYGEGIAYQNEIICACCGWAFPLKDILEEAYEDNIEEPIISYSNWIDFSEALMP